ncbi:tetratricopeptide repeat protein [Dankookia sp. P2]|uniref:tetratricopeptide repeat protein n=1 Tax=Dankookia sp. P2 TaxID=3423955 RepID=UPI003D671C36
MRGALRRERGDVSGAAADFAEVLARTPRHPLALQGRARLRMDQGDLDGALADFGSLLRCAPANTDALVGRGIARALKGQWRAAVEEFDAAVRFDPKNATALADRGLARNRLGETRAAEADMADAILLAKPGNGWPYTARAGLALLRNDDPGAARDIEEALRRSPDGASALQIRAILRARAGDGAGSAGDAAAARRAMPRVAERVAALFGEGLVLPR